MINENRITELAEEIAELRACPDSEYPEGGISKDERIYRMEAEIAMLIITPDFDESVSMSILSQLSDIQETNPELRGKLNFVKSLVFKLKNGVKEIKTSELNELWRKWNN
jgi:hypothetical protein